MELKAIADDIETAERKELTTHIDELTEALSETNMPKAKLPESVFKEFFLPALSGEESDNRVAVMKYIEYAGTAYSEVDIIDKTGNVLFTCPPLYDRSINKANSPTIPYTEIAGTYELKKSRMVVEANNYMTEVVGNIRTDVDIDKTSGKERWQEIFKGYKEETKPSDIENNPTIDDSELDDLIDYD